MEIFFKKKDLSSFAQLRHCKPTEICTWNCCVFVCWLFFWKETEAEESAIWLENNLALFLVVLSRIKTIHFPSFLINIWFSKYWCLLVLCYTDWEKLLKVECDGICTSDTGLIQFEDI